MTMPANRPTISKPRPGPTPAAITAQQKADAEKDLQRKGAPPPSPQQKPAMVPATVAPTPSALSVPDVDTALARLRDEDGGSVGRPMAFDGKDGEFKLRDTDEPADIEATYIAHVPQLVLGRIKFCGEGVPAIRAGVARPYDKQVRPERVVGAGEIDAYGDNDPADWPVSQLSGQQEDPWSPFSILILERDGDGELFAFETRSKTGRSAVASLCTRYDRLQQKSPGYDLLIKLRPSGYQDHKRGIWVHKPEFVVVGKRPPDEMAEASGPPQDDFQDSLKGI